MKKIVSFFKSFFVGKGNGKICPVSGNRRELERKVEEGAKKALREYREVFERLAEYDRT